MSALSILRLIPYPPGIIVGGEVIFKGRDLLKVTEEDMRHIRGNEIAMIFQEPTTSLNPVLSVSLQLSEALELHRGLDKEAAYQEAIKLLKLVGIPDAERRGDDYPYQFSGGMQQRIMIAMALSGNPALLICAEPPTSVDVTVQAQLLEIIDNLRSEFGMAVIIITHNLGVVARYVDRVNVMYAGRLMETGPGSERTSATEANGTCFPDGVATGICSRFCRSSRKGLGARTMMSYSSPPSRKQWTWLSSCATPTGPPGADVRWGRLR